MQSNYCWYATLVFARYFGSFHSQSLALLICLCQQQKESRRCRCHLSPPATTSTGEPLLDCRFRVESKPLSPSPTSTRIPSLPVLIGFHFSVAVPTPQPLFRFSWTPPLVPPLSSTMEPGELDFSIFFVY